LIATLKYPHTNIPSDSASLAHSDVDSEWTMRARTAGLKLSQPQTKGMV
jgi:hypothetical protein